MLRSKHGPFGLCCENGRVQLNDFRQAPRSLRDLLKGLHAKKYLKHARQFNHAVAYAIFKCWSETLPGPLSDMRIQGAAYVASSGIRAERIVDAKCIQVRSSACSVVDTLFSFLLNTFSQCRFFSQARTRFHLFRGQQQKVFYPKTRARSQYCGSFVMRCKMKRCLQFGVHIAPRIKCS